MAINYTWEVTGLKTKTEGSNEKAVIQTYWKKTGTDDDGNVGSFSGATPFTSVDADPFIAFDELTEANVLGWIQAVVVDDYEAHVNGVIQKQIDAQVDPVVEADLPWISGE